MLFNQLRYFITTAQELHFARAAEKLGITQPALSRGIKNLEKTLDLKLFTRENKWHVELTPGGKAFLPEAQKCLYQLQYARNMAVSAGDGRSGKLTIGAISSFLGNPAFISTLTDMKKYYPDVAVEVIDSNSADLTKQIRERSIDLALMRVTPADTMDDGVECELLFNDRLLVALSHRHKLAKKSELNVSELAGENFIMVPARTAPDFRNFICNFCVTHGGFYPVITDEISSSYTALCLVEAGLGITVVSSTYGVLFGDRLRFCQFKELDFSLPVYAVRADGTPPPQLQNFMKLLKKNLKVKE